MEEDDNILRGLFGEKVSSLESFMWIVDTQYPSIKKYISDKGNDRVELEIPYEWGETWDQSSSVVEPIFKHPSQFPIKKSSVTFNERHSYFKVLLELN